MIISAPPLRSKPLCLSSDLGYACLLTPSLSTFGKTNPFCCLSFKNVPVWGSQLSRRLTWDGPRNAGVPSRVPTCPNICLYPLTRSSASTTPMHKTQQWFDLLLFHSQAYRFRHAFVGYCILLILDSKSEFSKLGHNIPIVPF